MLSVIPHRHKSTPLVVVASATAGLAVGTVAGAVLSALRGKPAVDGGKEQALDGAEG